MDRVVLDGKDMSTCYRYRDMNRVLAVNAPLAVKDLGKTYSAVSDGNGIVKFAETFSDQAVPYPVGFGTAIRISCDAPPPPPTPPGTFENGRVGTSCTILGQGSNGIFYYAIQHDRNGLLTSFRKMDWSDARDQANRIPGCFETPPPPPKTVDEVSKEVTVLQTLVNTIRSSVQDILDKITGIEENILGLASMVNKLSARVAELESFNPSKLIADLRAAVDGIWDKLEGWLIERIVGILLKGLDREVKEMK